MGTILVNTTSAFSDGDQITSDSLNNLIDDAILNTTAVSAGTGLTVNGTTGVLSMDSSLTGKVLTGGSLNNAPIGASTPNTGAFTTLSASSGYTGNVTGNLTGDVTGNISGNVTGGTGSFTTLTASGDVTFDTTTLKVDSTNNRVGIGIASPNAKLQIKTSASEVEGISVLNAGNTSEIFKVIEDGSNGGYVDIRNSSNTSAIRLNSSSDSYFNGGNVGIGTTLPQAILQTSTVDNMVASFKSTDPTAYVQIIDSVDATYIGSQSGIGFIGGSASVSSNNINIDLSNGKVGIGTTSPANALHVVGDDEETSAINTATATSLEVAGNGPSINSGGTMLFSANGGSWKFAAIKALVQSGSNNSVGDLAFSTRPASSDSTLTEAMRIKYDGNVGIGDPTPSYKLDVNGDIRATGAIRDSAGDAGTSGQILSSTGTGTNWVDNTGGSSQWVTTGSDIYYNTGNVGINDSTPSYKLDVNGTGRFVGQLTLDDELLHNISGTQNRLPGYYAGTYGVEIEQTAQGSTVHIGRSSGNCMNIGADATAAGTDVNVVYFRDTGAGVGGPPAVSTEVGKIVINTTSTNYSTSSDYRLKENEVVISDGIDRLKQLNVYRFNFIKEPSKVVDGFFAHEVSPVVPESISGEKDQVDDEGNPVYQGIDQSKLVPLLTAALQEAVAKIEALEARVQTLEG